MRKFAESIVLRLVLAAMLSVLPPGVQFPFGWLLDISHNEAFAQTPTGQPFGSVCPVTLPPFSGFANTAASPSISMMIWDGAQCVPWGTLNTSTHTFSGAASAGTLTSIQAN